MRHTATLPARAPFDGERLLAFLQRRAVPGIEEVIPGGYRRSVVLAHGTGVVELVPGADHVEATFVLQDARDLDAAADGCRRLLDLDRDPAPIAAHLGADPVIGHLVRAAPGRRVPGHPDGCELALRAVLGQQVSVAAGTRLVTGIVAELGRPLAHPVGEVTHVFPPPAAIAELDPETLPMPLSRGRTLVGVAAELAGGRLRLDETVNRAEVYAALLALPGIGPWTAGYIAMRALRDPDAFIPGDAGLRHGLVALGLDPSPHEAERVSEPWRPYRAYAIQHLWALAA
ncbi:MAG TPA: DNA-3-methyladenine glycosylase [Solirubrobacteraceae bacterium]|jgi:AraC family transcriptional regulator of adaptative response / DNA-3-methyladenine glycosylase II|nr:DNA-3-methyladenine glycosylase [Solirubrobacteraceae bacterium]